MSETTEKMRTTEFKRLNDKEFIQHLILAKRDGIRNCKAFGEYMVRQFGYRLLMGDTTPEKYWENRLKNKITSSENLLKTGGERIIAQIVEKGKKVGVKVGNVKIDVENANTLLTLLRSVGWTSEDTATGDVKKTNNKLAVSDLLAAELEHTVTPPPSV